MTRDRVHAAARLIGRTLLIAAFAYLSIALIVLLLGGMHP